MRTGRITITNWLGVDVTFIESDFGYLETWTSGHRPPYLCDGIEALLYVKGCAKEVGLNLVGLKNIRILLDIP